ncbi:HNH endonuclease signature motif containing protein [Kribbella antiqua]|nr:HNH endonuclease signature motif containing protein [Kribbella antiqua]
MFDDDLDELDTADLLVAAAQFVDVQEHAAVRLLEAALAYADRHAVIDHAPDRGEVLPGTERLKVYGGDGCPGVAEFAPVEFGAVTRMSTGAAASFIGEALALRHRLPRIWAAVLAGNAVAWRARKIAHACLSLSLEAAAIVDRRVVGIVNTVTPTKLATIVKAAMWEADPDLARAHAEAVAKARGVYVGPSDDHGTKRFWVRAAAGDVIRFDATINDIAHALKILGDPDSLDERRAKAIGWIADPAAAHHLLQVARYLARTRPHIPDNDDNLSTTPARGDSDHTTEDTGPTEPPDDWPAEDDYPNSDHWPAPNDRPTGHDEPVDALAGHINQDAETDTDPRCDPTDDAVVSEDSCAPDSSSPSGEPTSTGPDSNAETDDDARADASDPALPADWAVSDDDPGPEGWDDPDHHGTAADSGASGMPPYESDAFTRRTLAGSLPARLAALKQHAYSHGLAADTGQRANRHTLYVHLTDKALATRNGVLRVEELGPLLLNQLSELLGHDQIVVKPVIDLAEQVNVHSYEIPDRIRERVRLRHPVDMFPYGAAEATTRMDQDHITPYDRTGPPGQTDPDNLIPLGRLHHRAKTFGGWQSRRLPTGGIEWTSPHGFRFHVDHTGTHPVPPVGTPVDL